MYGVVERGRGGGRGKGRSRGRGGSRRGGRFMVGVDGGEAVASFVV